MRAPKSFTPVISAGYKELIEKSNNNLLYSVPYHPETNAIEEFFSQLKHYIKKESPKQKL